MRLICQTALVLAALAAASCAIHPAPPSTKPQAASGPDSPPGGTVAGTSTGTAAKVSAGGTAKLGFASVSAGENHTCGVKTDSTVACWGSNSAGQATPPLAWISTDRE